MASRTKLDDNVRQIITDTVSSTVTDPQEAACLTEKLTKNLLSSYSESAIKRRNSYSMRSCFKAGFMLAKKFGKYCQWHEQYWTKSSEAQEIKQAANDDAPVFKSRYAALIED